MICYQVAKEGMPIERTKEQNLSPHGCESGYIGYSEVIAVADIQTEVMQVLLKSLLDQDLIEKYTYDSAVNMVHSTIDFGSFFEYPVCCPKEGEKNGSS